jgi:tetratricopeptide (TPR) repeat protein
MINRNRLILVFITTLVVACASAPEKAPPELLSEASTQLDNGVTQYNQASFAKAEKLFEQAMYLYRSIDNPRGTASSYINLAKTALSQNHISATNNWLQKAQAIVTSEHLADLQNHITIIRSSIAIETNDLSLAKTLLTSLLETRNVINADTRLAAVQNRTRIAFAENNDAAAWTERYAKLVTNDNPHAEARLARFRAILSADSTEQDQYYQRALDINRKLAWRPGLATTLSEWAEHNIKAHNYTGAENKLERALLIRLDLRDNHGTSAVLTQLNMVYGELGQTTKQQRATYWSPRLTEDKFYDWDKVLKDFET